MAVRLQVSARPYDRFGSSSALTPTAADGRSALKAECRPERAETHGPMHAEPDEHYWAVLSSGRRLTTIPLTPWAGRDGEGRSGSQGWRRVARGQTRARPTGVVHGSPHHKPNTLIGRSNSATARAVFSSSKTIHGST
jgi:hypothetical protein